MLRIRGIQARLLKNLSHDFEPGKLHGILGPNGAGKSTLFHCLLGILPCKAGEIHLGQKRLDHLSLRERAQIMSSVPQGAHPSFAFRVWEMVEMGLYPLDPFPCDSQERVKKALQCTSALDIADRPFAELSGGEQQRVYIARALVSDPEILVLDEPGNSLDLEQQFWLWEHLRDLAQQGKTILVATHSTHLARIYAQEVVVIQKGKIVSSGRPGEALSRDLMKNIFSLKEDVLKLNFII